MKKVMALITTILMAAVLGSCGGTEEAPATTTTDTGEAAEDINLTMYWWGNQVRNEGTQDVLNLYAEENPNIYVEGQFAPWGDYWNKLATLAAGQAMPDVIQMDYSYLNQYVENDLLVDLTPYVESGVLDASNIDDSLLQSGMIDGGLYAIPVGINAPSLLYNKTLLDENGIEINDYMSIEEFMDISREVYEKTGYKTNISYFGGTNYLEYYMRGKGIDMYEGNKINGTVEDYVPFFEMYEIGLDEGWLIEPDVFSELAVGTVEQDPMIYGSTPETMSWCSFPSSNQIAAYQAAAPEGMELGITTYPSDDPEKSLYLKPSMFFSVGVNSENPEEAAKVINFFINSSEANDIMLSERGVPPSSVIAEEQLPQLDEVDQEVVRYINDVVTPNCSPISPPAPEGLGEVANEFNLVLEQLCYGNYDAETAAEEFYNGATEILSN